MKGIEPEFVVGLVTQSVEFVQHGFDFSVCAFNGCAGDPRGKITEDAFLVAQQGFSHGMELADAASDRLLAPACKELLPSTFAGLLPEQTQLLFEQVRSLARIS